MYKYDIKRDEWEDTNRPMKETRWGHSCLLLDNEVFVVGGRGRKTTEIFNLQSRTWRSGPDLPKAIHNSQLVKSLPSSQYSAFLIGGYDYYNNASSYIFALSKNFKRFITIGNLKTARKKHVAMVLSEKLVEKCVD